MKFDADALAKRLTAFNELNALALRKGGAISHADELYSFVSLKQTTVLGSNVAAACKKLQELVD